MDVKSTILALENEASARWNAGDPDGFPACAVLLYDYESEVNGQAFKMHCTEDYRLDPYRSFVQPN